MPYKYNAITGRLDLVEDISGAGDVVGPASSTDGDIALFDGATGKLLQDGGVGLPQNDGELIIGDTAGNAGIATLTGGTGITVTNGAASITIDADNNGDVTAAANLTDYAVVCGNGGAKGVQSIAGVGTSGQVLTSNGAGALPTFQSIPTSFSSINVQVFTADGTYTPTSGMTHCVIECVGGGGGGGASSTCSGSQVSVGSGGNSGVYARKFSDAATIGASQAVTIGTGGAGGTAPGGGGAQGTTTSLGTICTADGGNGGFGSAATSNFVIVGSGAVVSSGTGDFVVGSTSGAIGIASVSGTIVAGGIGGSSVYSGSNPALIGSASGPGSAGVLYGGGGNGAATGPSNSQQAGGSGADGICVITEYIS